MTPMTLVLIEAQSKIDDLEKRRKEEEKVIVRLLRDSDTKAVKKYDKYVDTWNVHQFKETEFVLIAIKNDNVVGLVHCSENEFSIDVAKKHQGMGIGDMMMKQLIHQCEKRHIDHLYLVVEATNHKAIKLYLKHGFIPVGIDKAKCYMGMCRMIG